MHSLNPLLKCLIASCLCLLSWATYYYFHDFERYLPQGEALITHSPDKSNKGFLIVKYGDLQFSNILKDKSVNAVWYLDAPENKHLLLTSTISLKNVVGGKKHWQQARIYITGKNSTGKGNAGKWRWFQGASLFSGAGSADHITLNKIVTIPNHFERLRVSAQLARSTGLMTIHSLSLHTAYETTASIIFKYALIFIWSIGLLLAVRIVLKDQLPIPALIASTLFGMLLVMPGSQKTAVNDGVFKQLDTVANVIKKKVTTTHTSEATTTTTPVKKIRDKAIHVRKLLKKVLPKGLALENAMHTLLFFTLTLIVLVSAKLKGISLAQQFSFVFYLLIYAGITESLQNFSPGRTASLGDFSLNIIGIGLGIVFFYSTINIAKLIRH